MASTPINATEVSRIAGALWGIRLGHPHMAAALTAIDAYGLAQRVVDGGHAHAKAGDTGGHRDDAPGQAHAVGESWRVGEVTGAGAAATQGEGEGGGHAGGIGQGHVVDQAGALDDGVVADTGRARLHRGDGGWQVVIGDGAAGLDVSTPSGPPHHGMAALRLPVRGMPALAAHLRGQGVAIAMAPTRVCLAPHGEVTVMAARSPEGAWLEFYEPAVAAGAAA